MNDLRSMSVRGWRRQYDERTEWRKGNEKLRPTLLVIPEEEKQQTSRKFVMD